MQVNAPSSLLQILLASQAKRPAAAAFPSELAAQPSPVASGIAAPSPSVQMLVALAAVTPASIPERRRRVVREAEKAMDALEMLQAALVVGVGSAEPIAQLQSWTEGRPHLDDPELAELLDEIDLRVQVELAKLRRE
jgi:DhnA family fructose-bisphosphate aldolase class Ia